MQILISNNSYKNRNILLSLLWTFLLVLALSAYSQAAAPSRAKPYAESVCNNPDVFFCEDFEGEDIVNYGDQNCNSTWGNPALQRKDGSRPANFCWAGGGSYQFNTESIPGFGPTNKVWRITKSTGFADIVTGINTGTGSGTISGWLNPGILGSGAQEWYTRVQVWFSANHVWPEDYDFKMFFALPRDFVDAPSAVYETGIYFHQDFWCSGQYFPTSGKNFNDIPVIRYSSSFRQFPRQDEYCPPLNPGETPNGTQAPRIEKGRWYTLEYHIKLASNNTGILELWVDGVKAFSTSRITCHDGCPNMGFIYIMGWMNPADTQRGYYEIDNVVMSRKYIGLPSGSTPPSGVALEPPTNLKVISQQ
jgi:hypothetical protein